MKIIKKIQYYRKLALVLFAVNVFSAALGIATFITYFTSKREFAQTNELYANHLNALDDVNDQLIHLVGIAKLNDPESLFQKRKMAENLETVVKKLNQENIIKNPTLGINEKLNSSFDFETALREVHQARVHVGTQINENAKRSIDLHQHLLWVGLVTLTLGIALPLLIIHFITRRLNEARQSFQLQVSQWISQWIALNKTYGGRFYQQPEFWLQILLLTTELFAEKAKHPIILFFADIASMIRTDLLRQKFEKDETSPHSRVA